MREAEKNPHVMSVIFRMSSPSILQELIHLMQDLISLKWWWTSRRLHRLPLPDIFFLPEDETHFLGLFILFLHEKLKQATRRQNEMAVLFTFRCFNQLIAVKNEMSAIPEATFVTGWYFLFSPPSRTFRHSSEFSCSASN